MIGNVIAVGGNKIDAFEIASLFIGEVKSKLGANIIDFQKSSLWNISEMTDKQFPTISNVGFMVFQ